MCVLVVRLCLNGEIPKWPTGADCKSAGECLRRFESCSPHFKRIATVNLIFFEEFTGLFGRYQAGVAQLVEHQPSKLRVADSSSVSRSLFEARVAQGSVSYTHL